MFDFDKKLEEGAKAQETASENKKEIRQVLVEFSKSIGKLIGKEAIFVTTAERKDDDKKYDPIELARNSLLAGISSSGLLKPLSPLTGYLRYQLRVENDEKKQLETTVLFKIKQEDSGYPLVIRYKKKEITCRDQDSFVEVLGSIATEVSFHESLAKLKG
ncbi:hypothetical protein [Photobacterium leiognathi]|uniref:hypothetical protein n=1 Tax=Photobacterium leiognathi TaxID=553611 RepID=UPI002981BB84|nr:hypothetical protein [Photobacterium leiognathi]